MRKSTRLSVKAKNKIAEIKEHGVDLHPCPVCGRLCVCDGISLSKKYNGPGERHYIICTDHGMQSWGQHQIDTRMDLTYFVK